MKVQKREDLKKQRNRVTVYYALPRYNFFFFFFFFKSVASKQKKTTTTTKKRFSLYLEGITNLTNNHTSKPHMTVTELPPDMS